MNACELPVDFADSAGQVGDGPEIQETREKTMGRRRLTPSGNVRDVGLDCAVLNTRHEQD